MEQNKIVIIGNAKVGKTTLTKKLINEQYNESYIPTLGVEVYPHCYCNLWDTAGEEKFGGLRDGYYIQSTHAIVVCNLNNKKSCEKVKQWIIDVKTISPNVKILILGNIFNKDKTTYKEKIQPFIEQYNTNYLEMDILNDFSNNDIEDFISS